MTLLLQNVAREFGAVCKVSLEVNRAELTLHDESLQFYANECVEKSLLSRTSIAEFVCVFGGEAGDIEIHLTHSGAVKRTGIDGRAIRGKQSASATMMQLLNDKPLATAMLPLDFTRLVVIRDANGWRAQIQLMGASYVTMSFPPTKRYVPMGREQVEALLKTLLRLKDLLS
jgi:hypothetical protein